MLRDMIFTPPKGDVFYSYVLLVPESFFIYQNILNDLVMPLVAHKVPKDQILALCVPKNVKTAAQVTDFLEKLERPIKYMNVSHILCSHGPTFKKLTKNKVVKNKHGNFYPSIWDIPVMYCPSPNTAFFDSTVAGKIEYSLDSFASRVNKSEELVSINIHTSTIPELTKASLKDIEPYFKEPKLYIDIETTGLEVFKHNITTIGVSNDAHKAIAVEYFTVDSYPYWKSLFKNYKGTMIFHGGTFDIKFLIRTLYMKNSTDYVGMLEGLNIFFRGYEDTKILAFLATNHTARTELGLKDLAYQYLGDYGIEDFAVDTPEMRRKVAKYNAMDVIATAYVYDTYIQEVQGQQKHVYKHIFCASQKVLTAMELVGLPLNFVNVLRVEKYLANILEKNTLKVLSFPEVTETENKIREHAAAQANATYKKKRVTAEDYVDLNFNIRSSKHLQTLLYDTMGCEIQKVTKSGQPSTSAEALGQIQKNFEYNNDPRLELIQSLRNAQKIQILLSTFLPAFKSKSIFKKDGWRYLLGSFNLPGPVSGRMSSANPNLQNIPSTGTEYAKVIKKCFQAPKGWLLVGADFASLEDRISALLTKDPNKLAVYTDHYDGHCLRAYSYFSKQMPDITQELGDATSQKERVEIINTIKHRYPELRQKSKGPTFALTYMGTWRTLVETFGLSATEAKQIEKEYHNLYKVSDDWVMKQLTNAQETGFVELAFGLQLRTPSLTKCLNITEYDSKIPKETHKEMKTAGNALGQSYGLLNNRAANAFMKTVWKSRYKHDILPCGQIHDSQYYLIKNDINVLHFVNKYLIKEMSWNALPAIHHPLVGLEAELEVYYPTWADPIHIPNNASKSEIKRILHQAYKEKHNE